MAKIFLVSIGNQLDGTNYSKVVIAPDDYTINDIQSGIDCNDIVRDLDKEFSGEFIQSIAQVKAEYWESKAKDINLSMPESIEYFEYKVEQAKERHEGLKNGTIERSHSFSLTYAKKDLNEAEKNLQTAKKLWA